MQKGFSVLHDILLFFKEAETAAEQRAIDHEAFILALAAHPGVVTLVGGPGGHQGRSRLYTRAVRGRPLTTFGNLSAGEVAGLGAAVATTLGDLHDLGIIHHGLTSQHILLTPGGAPVLCGFARATLVAPPARAAATPDVADLTRILAALVEPRSGQRYRLLDRTLRVGGSPSAQRLAHRLRGRSFRAILPARHPLDPTSASPVGRPARSTVMPTPPSTLCGDGGRHHT